MQSIGGNPEVIIREVGPRDGLQILVEVMPTEAKLAWIEAMAAAGIREIEVASFVPPRLVPGMADAAEVTTAVRAAHPLVYAVALVPNLRGARDAVAAGAQSIVVPVSASEAHNKANLRRTREAQLSELAQIVSWTRSLGTAAPKVEAGIATAFGCSLQGMVPEYEVVALAGKAVQAGANFVSLADTLGYASPGQVRRLVRMVSSEIGPERFGHIHLHDTMGLALANIFAALEGGARRFDAALGGMGGCPNAPGAEGNVATEDLVYLLESEGCRTGVDLYSLLRARELLGHLLPGRALHGHLAGRDVPPTYRPAVTASAGEREHAK